MFFRAIDFGQKGPLDAPLNIVPPLGHECAKFFFRQRIELARPVCEVLVNTGVVETYWRVFWQPANNAAPD